MALTARVKRLEQAPGALTPPRCPSCGVPQGWVPHWRWVDDLGADLDPVCQQCGFPLDADGEALMSAPPTTRTLLMVVARTCPAA